jgi:hypothetical protein
VLCERGVISFYDKVMNVQNNGGTAAVIYNNAPGGFAGTLGAGNTSTIPAISLSQEDGKDLVAKKLKQRHGYQHAENLPAATKPGMEPRWQRRTFRVWLHWYGVITPI